MAEFTQDIYKQTIENYYPLKGHSFDLSRFVSLQHKNLLDVIKKSHNNKDYLNTLKLILKEFGFFNLEMGGNFPCYIFQSIIENDTNQIKVFSLYISFLTPAFHLTCLIGNKNTKVIVEHEINDQNKSKIEFALSNKLGLNKFPIELLHQNIEYIFLEEKFTYFNAYFCDAHRILKF